MTEPLARTPLTDDALPALTGMRLEAVAPGEILNVRGNGGDPAFTEAVASALGCPPPVTPNTWAPGEGLHLLWVGPDEWLAVVDAEGPSGRLAALRNALGTQHAAVTALGAGYAAVQMAGERARDALSRGTPLDIHPREFGPGQCAQTRLAHASVVLWQLDAAPTFRLLIRRSMSGYLRDWLHAVMRRMDG